MEAVKNEIARILKENEERQRRQKVLQYRILNQYVRKGQILFTGSSLMEQFPVNELLMSLSSDKIIYNRGIGGFTTDDMLAHMEEQIFGVAPSRIFINIGTNDIADAGRSFEDALKHLLTNYRRILAAIAERLPRADVFIMAYYPVNEPDSPLTPAQRKDYFLNRNNENLAVANRALESLAESFSFQYIDVNDGLLDEQGNLKKEFTIEGVHMYANAYQVILNNLLPYL